MIDNARTSQLGKERLFIYLTQQRHGVKLFASRELSPSGVSKRLLQAGAPGAFLAQRMIAELLRLARDAAGGPAMTTPTPDLFAPLVDEAARRAGAANATFLRRSTCYSARILVTL